MPLYEYIDPKTRVRRLRRLPVRLRDSRPGRVPVPAGVFTCPRGEPAQRETVLEGFRKVESQIGATELARQSGFSAAQVKRIWERSPSHAC